jgi:hypothetical protein
VSQKFENIFALAKRLVQQILMAGAGVSTFFICLRTMTQSYINYDELILPYVMGEKTRLTNISQPHIPILCNAQVAFRMVP